MEIAERPEAKAAVRSAEEFVISNDGQLENADKFQTALQALEKTIKSDFKKSKEQAWSAHKAIVAQEAKHLKPVQQARKILKSKMANYQEEQERIRQEEERKAQEAARAAAEQSQLEEAEHAEEMGDKKRADEILSKPVDAAPVVVPRKTPKTATVLRKVWAYEIVDEAKIPREFLAVDVVKIGKAIRALGNSLNIPGIRVYQKTV